GRRPDAAASWLGPTGGAACADEAANAAARTPPPTRARRARRGSSLMGLALRCTGPSATAWAGDHAGAVVNAGETRRFDPGRGCAGGRRSPDLQRDRKTSGLQARHDRRPALRPERRPEPDPDAGARPRDAGRSLWIAGDL